MELIWGTREYERLPSHWHVCRDDLPLAQVCLLAICRLAFLTDQSIYTIQESKVLHPSLLDRVENNLKAIWAKNSLS